MNDRGGGRFAYLWDRKKLFTTSYESNEVIDVTGAGDIVAAIVSSFYKKTDIK